MTGVRKVRQVNELAADDGFYPSNARFALSRLRHRELGRTGVSPLLSLQPSKVFVEFIFGDALAAFQLRDAISNSCVDVASI